MRISTFNAENLFSRAKLLNMPNEGAAAKLLDKVNKLQQLLKQKAYSDQTKQEMVTLQKDVSQVAFVNEEIGKLWKHKGNAITGVQAAGSADWSGSIVLLRDTLNNRAATGKVVRKVAADVQCMVEIEDRKVLDVFNRELLKKWFDYDMLIDSLLDPRGINVGLYSKSCPLVEMRSHCYDTRPNSTRPVFSRDCLQVQLSLSGGKSLYLLCNHFKSQIPSYKGLSSDQKRLLQATRVAAILKSFDLTKDYVIVCGDFNDVPNSKALQPLLTVADLHDVFDLGKVATANRWTYQYNKKTQQIDYLLVSTALSKKFKDVGVERSGMPSATLSDALSASDHGAVWADFDIS